MKIKKKKIKVNIDLCSASNKNSLFLFETGKNYQYLATNIFHVKNVIFFSIFAQNTGRAGQIILKLSTKILIHHRRFIRSPHREPTVSSQLPLIARSSHSPPGIETFFPLVLKHSFLWY